MSNTGVQLKAISGYAMIANSMRDMTLQHLTKQLKSITDVGREVEL